MKRLNIYFPENLIDCLKKESKETGVPISETLRRLVKEYLKKKESLVNKGRADV